MSASLILSDRIIVLGGPQACTSHDLIDTGSSLKTISGSSFARNHAPLETKRRVLFIISPILAIVQHLCPHTAQGTEIEHRRRRGLFTSTFSIFAERVPAGIIVPTVWILSSQRHRPSSGLSPSPCLIYPDDGHQRDPSFVWLGWQMAELPPGLALIRLRGAHEIELRGHSSLTSWDPVHHILNPSLHSPYR